MAKAAIDSVNSVGYVAALLKYSGNNSFLFDYLIHSLHNEDILCSSASRTGPIKA